MCKATYISSPFELPTSEFIPDETYFYLEEGNSEEIKKHFSQPFIYYCGAYTCCSCGFCFDFKDPDLDPDEEDEWGKKSVQELFDFLKANIKSNQYFEIYSCWEGDEDQAQKNMIELNLFSFTLDAAFAFKDFELIKIINKNS